MKWESQETEILLNPRQVGGDKLRALLQREGKLPGHVWFLTSGTTGRVKCVALSKSALLASAAAVNRHLQAVKSDRWLNCLPPFHVGGAGIFARAYLSGSEVCTMSGKWDPHLFLQAANEKKATLTALVPTQLYDLAHLPPPPSLRAVIIGGGAVSERLFERAKGWPLMPSYGLTECASQVATAQAGSRSLQLLNHIEAKVEEFLKIKSPALLTTYAFPEEGLLRFHDPKVEGWFTTEDLAEINGPLLTLKGRSADFVKISGESVDLKRLDGLIEELSRHAALFPLPHERLGHALHLAYTPEVDIEKLLEQYHCQVMPFERVHQTHLVSAIPRSPLNKILKQELITLFFQR